MFKKLLPIAISAFLLSGCVSSDQTNTDSVDKAVPQVQKTPAEPQVKETPTEVKVSNPFTPWSTSFDALEVIKSALKNTDDYFGSVEPNRSYELVIDKSFPSSELTWIKEMLSYSNGSLSRFESDNFKVFISGSPDWSRKTLRDKNLWVGDPKSKFPCNADWTNEGSCADNNLVLINYFNVKPNEDWYVSRRAIPAHEIFHIFQDSLSGLSLNMGPDDPRAIPTWLIEGSANFYGFYVVDRMGFNNYNESRSSRSWYDYSTGPQVPLIKYNNFSSDPYTIGQLATEYLVASVGFESLMNVFNLSKTEESFSDAFKQAVGISLDEFYLKFESSRSLMYVG